MAVLALTLALGSVAVRHGARRESLAWLGLLLLCGTLIATPQIVEFLRIVGSSYRGHLGYSSVTRTSASWDPRQVAEWLIPFAFGRPDQLGAEGFWGHRFFTGHPPYYFSLYPGLLSLTLAVAAMRGGTRSRWPLVAAAAGLFLALGRFNPAVAWLFEAGAGLVRYPVRMWLLSAIGGALLAGIGYERCFFEGDRRARRWLFLALGALAGAFLFGRLAIALLSARLESWIAGFLPAQSPPGSATAAVSRWAGLCLISLALVALLGLASALATRFPREGGALLLAMHAATQVALLAPLMASDSTTPYLAPGPIVEAIPPEAPVAHGGSEGLFGAGSPAPRDYPGGQASWFARRAFFESYPFAGTLRGRRYELNVSSEGLDSFLSTAARDAVRLADDADRLRLLAAWGVEYLILDRPLDPAASDQVEPVRRLSSFGGSIDLYRIQAAAPPLVVAGRIVRAPHLNAAVAALKDPSFNPRTMVVLPVVLPGGGPAIEAAPGGPGTSRLVESGPEKLSADVESGSPGVLVIQRAWLPLYRASLDGAEVPVRIANLHRIGVEVPAGRHRVDLWVDRRPLWFSLCLTVLGAALLAALWRRLRLSHLPDTMSPV
jgi:hypothetical protein